MKPETNRKADRIMKQFRILIWLSIFCLLLSACRATQTTQNAQTTPTTESSEQAVPESTGTDKNPMIAVGQLAFQNPGKQRIGYKENQSGVLYITSATQLPSSDAFKQYDDAFFQDHALVLVTQTVGSGSVQLEIESIFVSGDTAIVTISHNLPGDVGTSDMATWYLWAEVEAGLDLKWTVAGIAKNDSFEIHTH
jgi:hypothetical protein